jgi:hypothetical protein
MDDLLSQALDKLNEPEPTVEFEPMLDALATKEPKKDEYSGDEEGLKKAAAEVSSRRETQEITERHYLDAQTGERMPENQTVSLKRAAADLGRLRDFEDQLAQTDEADALRFTVDAVRAGQDPVALAKQQLEQQEKQQNARPDPIQPQPTTELPGIDPEIASALQRSPKLRATLEQEAVRVRQIQSAAVQAQQNAAAVIQGAHQAAVNATIGMFPEIAGLTLEQVPVALNVLEKNNPVRFNQIVSHLSRVDQLQKANSQVQAIEHAKARAQVQQWTQAQDRVMEEYLAKNETPETVRSVTANLVKVAEQTYGISRSDLQQALASTPLLRSHQFARIIFDAVKYNLAKQGTGEKISNALPPVQRPGVSQPRASRQEADTSAAYKKFISNPDPKTAAAYLLAKRTARGG